MRLDDAVPAEAEELILLQRVEDLHDRDQEDDPQPDRESDPELSDALLVRLGRAA